MQELPLYLLKVSIAMTLMTCFYQLFLRRLTFYNANRFFLLMAAATSFVLPLIDISLLFHNTGTAQPAIISWVPLTQTMTGKLAPVPALQNEVSQDWSTGHYVAICWISGMLVLIVRLLISMISLAKLRARCSVKVINGIEVCIAEEHIVPFSFGQKIFLPSNAAAGDETGQILSHELVHVRQRHTVDLVVSEIVCLLQWFNPFAWILKKAIRQNLEFIADNHVISTGVGRQEYQLLLLSVMGRRSYGITSQFNLSSLKNRINMMNKNRNSRTQLLRFAILLPLTAIVLLSFRTLAEPSESSITYVAVVMDQHTRMPVQGMNVKDLKSGLQGASDGKGLVRLVYSGSGPRELDLQFYRTGYASLTSRLSVSTKTNDNLELTELVAMSQGDPNTACGNCFTSLFMGKNDLLDNPVKALEDHLANNGRPTATGTAKVRSVTSVGYTTTDSAAVSGTGGRTTLHGSFRFRHAGAPESDSLHLVIVDGTEMNWNEFLILTDTSNSRHLNPELINSISILDSKEGAKVYGKKGGAGVVIIETKKPEQ